MKLEYVDYHNPNEVTTSSSLSALETLCPDSELLERIQYTAAVMEQLAERRQGKYTARLGETGNLFSPRPNRNGFSTIKLSGTAGIY